MRNLFRSVVLAAAVSAGLWSITSLAQDAKPDAGSGRPPITFSTDPKPPVAVDGWKVETVLMAPQIESPSVVCALPDGRVLFGEDPLDNRGGKEPIDRIMCLWPDGKLTVWADKLYPVFGLAYLDGKVFVHQFPILSVYDDVDGKATNRKDLIDHTGKPTIGGLNDHIPAQIRLGMDGYFYMTSGDRGVWGAKSNVDGSEAEVPGGGLMRFRPDGTKLETYATGTRNHLDVSMTSEDEKFTYDNTDDGHGWWTRFTHMVDGGYYGYPWDYKASENKNDPFARKAKQEGTPDKPFQPYTLWRAAEYGGGSPCGAIGYTEDALPLEYRDNLFHCDWGKGKVQRFVVERAGGTFKVAKMEDFLIPGGDLRPLGICQTDDGMGFWVTDWGYGGWHQNKPKVGRLVKVTWTGKSLATPKPAWYVPAATGKKFEATTADLIEGLKHPARSVRMVAQRRLHERAQDAAPDIAASTINELSTVIRDKDAKSYARWHAMWAVANLPKTRQAAMANVFIFGIAGGVQKPQEDISVRRQALRWFAETGRPNVGGVAEDSLNDPDPSIRFWAATALGRTGQWMAVSPLLSKLDEKDLYVRFAIFTALNRIGKADPKSWPEIVVGLESKSDAVRDNTTYALRNTYDTQLVNALVKEAYDKSKPSPARVAALLSAADLHRQPKPWAGNWWGTQPVGSPRPPKVVDWEGTTTVLGAIRDLSKDADPAVRLAALKAMTIAPDPTAVDLLVDLFGKTDDVPSKKLLLQALAGTKSPKAAELAGKVLTAGGGELSADAVAVLRETAGKEAIPVLTKLAETAKEVDVAEPAIDTLGSLKAADAVPAIASRLVSEEPRVWNAAVTALQSINNKPAIEALIAALKDKRTEVRKSAVVALGQMKAHDAVPAIVEAIKTKKVSGDGTQALGKMPDVRALDIYLNSVGDKNFGAARDAKNAIAKIKEEALPIIEQKLAAGEIKPEAIAPLQEVLGEFEAQTQWQVAGPFSPKVAISNDLAKLTKPSELKVDAAGGAQWTKIKTEKDGVVALGKMPGAGERGVAVLLAEINSKSAKSVSLRIVTTGTTLVWLNGAKLEPVAGTKAGEAMVPSAKFNAGKNILVIQSNGGGADWNLSLAIGADRGGKLFDTKPVAPKNDHPTREQYAEFAAKNKGDAAKGKAVFLNVQTASCIKCHQLSPTEGGIVGPSLVGVGTKYQRPILIESILYPSKQILDGYQQTEIRTKDGDVIAGVVKAESEADITIYDSQANKQVVKKADVKSRKISQLSVMPEGLEQPLSLQEFADLIAFVESLKESPK